MAGQPQDPWQSSEQDQGRPAWQTAEQDQARPAWQSYGAPAADQQGTYAYPQPGPGAQAAQGAQGAQAVPGAQGYGAGADYPQSGGYAAPSYTVRDQPFGAQDQAFGGQAFGGQAFGGQPYQQPQQNELPPWQAAPPGPPAGKRKKAGGKGFLGSLFDFSFSSFVTPKIIKVIYVLLTIWTIIWALIFLRFGFKYGGAAGGFFTLLIVDPILIVLTLGAYRMVLELFMVVHRMHEDLKAIRERGGN